MAVVPQMQHSIESSISNIDVYEGDTETIIKHGENISVCAKFHIEIYGCQMNVYDAQRIAELLQFCGFEKAKCHEDADILIFYTCNIREKAAARLFSNINIFKNQKTKVVAVGGCVVQAEKENMFRHKAINIVFGPQVYHKLPEYIMDVINGKRDRIMDVGMPQMEKFKAIPVKQNVSYSEFVTIQEGCNNFCTYCIVPYTRGPECSRPAIDILHETKHLVENGAQEITLLGQNVNSYHGEAAYLGIGGKKTWDITRLLYEVAKILGIRRLRYVTSHPKDFNKELMTAHREIDVLVPFVHIPLQSGSNKILRLMNRGHTVEEYLDKLAMFRDIAPNIQFSSDFIVGFPQETDEDLQATIDAARMADYSFSYAFKYSPRKKTPASRMQDQIPEEEKEVRLAKLYAVLQESQLKYNQSIVGTIQETLFEKEGRRENQYVGKNVYLQSIVVEADESPIGKFMNVKITKATQNSVFGEIIQ